MANTSSTPLWLASTILAAGIVIGAYILGSSAIAYKEYERTVTVKGLSEREVPADLVVWSIRFSVADNELATLYQRTAEQTAIVRDFLEAQGFSADEIINSAPYTNDRLAQEYGSGEQAQYRYIANQMVTVRTAQVNKAREAMIAIAQLGEKNIAFKGSEYEQPQFSYTTLNDIKPAMIEEATQSAREVAEKFAKDSNSHLGKIKSANQGQFSIDNIDNSTPHIKKVRVVSTVEYYLAD